jgi:hypothetical protein
MSQTPNVIHVDEDEIHGISKSYEAQCPILCIYFKSDILCFPSMAFRIQYLSTLMNNGKAEGLYLLFQPSRLPSRFRILYKNIDHTVFMQHQINIYLNTEDCLAIESMSDRNQ